MSTQPPEGNGWGEWKNLVLSDLRKLEASNAKIESQLAKVSLELVQLKTKMGLYASVISFVVSVIVWLAHLFKDKY